MPKGRVEKCTWVAEWDFQGNKNHNFVIKFEGNEERFVYVGKDKENPKFAVGTEQEYEIKDKTIDVYSGGQKYQYKKIESPKPAFGGGGFGGGSKFVPKTPAQVQNDLIGFVGGYAKDIVCHRVNIGTDPDSIVKAYEILVTGMFNALKKHVQ